MLIGGGTANVIFEGSPTRNSRADNRWKGDYQ